MATHTPGPWTLSPHGIPYVNCGEHGPAYGPIVMAGPIEEMMANARLIAAAPDLLAELGRAAGALTEAAKLLRPTLKGCADIMDNHAAIARAAIAKATGEAA
jgi:hypothetical protein